MDIPLPERSLALAWLKAQGQGDTAEILLALARGAPLTALGMAGEGIIEKRGEFFAGWRDLLGRKGEPCLLAEKWSKFPCETLADWMISWTMDMIRLRAAPRWQGVDNLDLAERLQAAAQQINVQALFAYLDRLKTARRMLSGQVNRQLLLEELLILWRNAAAANPRKRPSP